MTTSIKARPFHVAILVTPAGDDFDLLGAVPPGTSPLDVEIPKGKKGTVKVISFYEAVQWYS